MESFSIVAQEVPISRGDINVSFDPNGSTSNIGGLIKSVHYSGGHFDLPMRGQEGYNAYNILYGIHPSIISSKENPYTVKIIPTKIGDSYHIRTASNRYMFTKEDLEHGVPTGWEDNANATARWKAVTENTNRISYSQHREFEGMIVAAQDVMIDPQLNKYKTPILAYSGPFNEFGPNLSRVFNIKLMRESYEASIENEWSVKSSMAHGYSKPIEVIGDGVGFLPEGAAMGVAGNGVFLVSSNLSSKVRAWAQDYDVPEHVVLAYLFGHEFKHLSGLPGDVAGETELEFIIGEEFEKFADNEHGGMTHNTANRTSRRTGYRQIARIARQREEDVIQNYGYSKLFRLPPGYSAEKAVERYTEEAIAIGVEDVEEYVQAKLNKEYQQVSKANDETSKETSGETLESRVESDSEVEEVPDNIIKFPERNLEYNEESSEAEAELEEAA